MDINILIKVLESRCGHTLTSPQDIEWLARDFKSRANESISVNTLKRMLGFLPYSKRHYKSTYDIVARYLGYKDWNELEKLPQFQSSDFSHNTDVLFTDDLNEDDQVSITYSPDRRIEFEYWGNHKFCVTSSENSKLEEDDIVVIHQFMLGNTLYVADVKRGGISLGEYTAAKMGGLTSIKYNKDDDDVEENEALNE